MRITLQVLESRLSLDCPKGRSRFSWLSAVALGLLAGAAANSSHSIRFSGVKAASPPWPRGLTRASERAVEGAVGRGEVRSAVGAGGAVGGVGGGWGPVGRLVKANLDVTRLSTRCRQPKQLSVASGCRLVHTWQKVSRFALAPLVEREHRALVTPMAKLRIPSGKKRISPLWTYFLFVGPLNRPTYAANMVHPRGVYQRQLCRQSCRRRSGAAPIVFAPLGCNGEGTKQTHTSAASSATTLQMTKYPSPNSRSSGSSSSSSDSSSRNSSSDSNSSSSNSSSSSSNSSSCSSNDSSSSNGSSNSSSCSSNDSSSSNGSSNSSRVISKSLLESSVKRGRGSIACASIFPFWQVLDLSAISAPPLSVGSPSDVLVSPESILLATSRRSEALKEENKGDGDDDGTKEVPAGDSHYYRRKEEGKQTLETPPHYNPDAPILQQPKAVNVQGLVYGATWCARTQALRAALIDLQRENETNNQRGCGPPRRSKSSANGQPACAAAAPRGSPAVDGGGRLSLCQWRPPRSGAV
eukprot:GHVT01066121.1.p1 GENE.GHVT01066121.1~~GHVT01066121.1.p1  ORF type:complete len:525 (+),score=78.10 GHVT01066121.1:287-1861(+)